MYRCMCIYSHTDMHLENLIKKMHQNYLERSRKKESLNL